MAIAISAVNVISSVGRDFVTACSAIRAGISRPQPITDYEVVDEWAQESVSPIGHPIFGFAEGFNLIGFWLRVGGACLDGLLMKLTPPIANSEWERTALICLTPHLYSARFQTENEGSHDLVRQLYVVPLCRQLDLPIPEKHRYYLSEDRIGLFKALNAAEKLLTSAEIDRVLLLVVDSMLDSLTLEWLASYDRLKTPSHPVGLTPGEGAVSFVITRQGLNKSRISPTLAIIHGLAIDRDNPAFDLENASRGRGLANTIKMALNKTGAPTPFVGDIFTDLNGEEWRALEFGNAQVLLHGILEPHYRMLMPCMSVGDIGAGATSLGLAMAIWYSLRGCARSKQSLVIGSSERGDVGALCLHPST